MATTNKYYLFLERLRKSNITNMYGASPFLMAKFDLDEEKAVEILSDWMNNYNPADYNQDEHTYYIVKPKSVKTDETLMKNIQRMDKKAVFIDDYLIADVIIMQKGWTNSAYCGMIYRDAMAYHKRIQEGYLYTDEYKVHLN